MTYLTYIPGLLLLASTSVFAQDIAISSEDIEPYVATPVAEQAADLKDDDNDGVINARDLCPGTPSQAEIDNDGCGTYSNSTEQKQLHILFGNNSSAINPIFLAQIAEMASFLKEYPTTSIELRGYASKTGDPDKNLILSKQRAEAVESQLVNNGIIPSRIKIIGYGDTNLVETGDDPVSHAKNRRVTASVVGYKGEISKRWSIFTSLPRVTNY